MNFCEHEILVDLKLKNQTLFYFLLWLLIIIILSLYYMEKEFKSTIRFQLNWLFLISISIVDFILKMPSSILILLLIFSFLSFFLLLEFVSDQI